MHQDHRKQQHGDNEDPCTDDLPLQQSVMFLLGLLLTLLFQGLFHYQVITCGKYGRTDFSGSQLVGFVRNGQCVCGEVDRCVYHTGQFLHCFFHIISAPRTVHVQYRKRFLYNITHNLLLYILSNKQ